MEIILIDIGIYQKYILDNIRNLKLFNNNKITIITDSHLLKHFENLELNVICTDNLDDFGFNKKSKLELGFWENTSKRLFYLYSYMKKYNSKNCIHLENDYMIYFSVDEMFSNLELCNKVWLTIDDSKRCIPGFIFVPDYSYLESLINNYDYNTNDMFNMYKFYSNNRNNCECLPMNYNYPFFEKFNMVFDAASIGQYLGGIDPIHEGGGIPGFINSELNINFSNYKFSWYKDENSLFIPSFSENDINYKVAGLHIHSKNLNNFQADYPNEQRLIKLDLNTYFITFGGPDSRYIEATDRLQNQAKSLNIFDNIKVFTPSLLKEDFGFWNKHENFITNNKRGYGYWIWKPYIILLSLNLMKEGDILLYCDSGCEIDIQKKNKFINLLNTVQQNDIVSSFCSLEIQHCKKELLKYLEMDNETILKSKQYQATSICLKKSEKTLLIVKKWYELAYTNNYNLINDSGNSEYPEYSEFIEHRHDQSIFSILMKKYYPDNLLILDEIAVLDDVIDLARNKTGCSVIKYNFDWEKYLFHNPDLVNAGINTQSKALKHWNRFGKKEGRRYY